jgi:D-glycero-alpha-D-manno-heptose-7-phosphate kinase
MIISQTPLRISFLGGGTDFEDYYKKNEGFVVSTAIDKYIFVILNERFDDYIVLNYSDKERVTSVEDIRHELVREALIKTGIKKSIEVTMIADIPSEGSGLGSSSCLTVGLLNAMYMYQGIQVTAEKLAQEACEIEINSCRKPIGKQDQYIAAYGGLCGIKFLKNNNVDVEKIILSDNQRRILGSNLLMFFTGITRKSSDILLEQKSKIKNIQKELDSIKKLAFDAKKSLYENKFHNLGNYLNKNWGYKKKFASNITNPQLDEMYKKSVNAGAKGGKILGAGGGGFLLLYCEREKQNKLRKALSQYREMPFLLEKDGSKIIFNYRRYSWK